MSENVLSPQWADDCGAQGQMIRDFKETLLLLFKQPLSSGLWDTQNEHRDYILWKDCTSFAPVLLGEMGVSSVFGTMHRGVFNVSVLFQRIQTDWKEYFISSKLSFDSLRILWFPNHIWRFNTVTHQNCRYMLPSSKLAGRKSQTQMQKHRCIHRSRCQMSHFNGHSRFHYRHL